MSGRTRYVAAAFCAVLASCSHDHVRPPEPPKPRTMRMKATAYSIEGIQKAGTRTREGTAAADPDVLPLGSRIRVTGDDGFVGEFVISDTGWRVQGRHIDIYLGSDAAAKRFGERQVEVEILELGTGPESARREVLEGLTPPLHVR